MSTFGFTLVLPSLTLSVVLIPFLSTGSLAQSAYNQDLACRQYADAQAAPYRSAPNTAAYAQQYYNSYYWNCMRSRQLNSPQHISPRSPRSSQQGDECSIAKSRAQPLLNLWNDKCGRTLMAGASLSPDQRANCLQVLAQKKTMDNYVIRSCNLNSLAIDLIARSNQGLEESVKGIRRGGTSYYHSNPRPIRPPSGGFAPTPGPGCGPPFC
jgi:hypothetical protein